MAVWSPPYSRAADRRGSSAPIGARLGLGQVEDQRAETEALMATEERAPEISPELVTALADAFGHFRDLTREEQRQLLREFWVRLRVRKAPGPGCRRVLQVDSIRLGLFHDNAIIYIVGRSLSCDSGLWPNDLGKPRIPNGVLCC